MRKTIIACLLVFHSLPLAAQQRVRGFTPDAQQKLLEREAVAKRVPHPDTLRTQLRILSEDPHEAGTDRSRHVAELILARFKAAGLDAKIEQFEALMPRPISLTLEVTAPERFTAKLQEPVIEQDKDARDAHQLPTFNAYSPDGDITAEVVYVNQGVPADYKVLDSLGISVKGKIVLARYGGSWRGIKPKVAAEHGAIGCIIYSDPKDDGYYVDDVYPKGPMRPWGGVQRGSVMDMPRYPGDPLTPGWAGEAGSKKLALKDVVTIEPIPVIPISYENALPILRNLNGKVVPDRWKGALPTTYHFGPGPATVHLALKFDWAVRPLYDVIARIPGATAPEQLVIYGNHHDAWVNGANDPLSGQVALLETARSLGQLKKQGWKPARTIILAAWDGEEWGLLGSTEWAEKHLDELRKGAVAYLNSDGNERGWLGAAGSHSLEQFVEEIARDVQDPVKKMSVRDAVIQRAKERDDTAALNRGFTIGALGSGSDYTAFIDHVGIASANMAYGGAQDDGMYHSVYDSFDFYTRFQDSTFAYGVLESQTTSTWLLRLADAVVLPFEFTRAAKTYMRYADELSKKADLTNVKQALATLQTSANAYEQTLEKLYATSSSKLRGKSAQLRALNKTLASAEQALVDDGGLPERPWFRHLIYAPGFYTGYGVKTMPGIREAIEDVPNAAVASAQAVRVAAALTKYAAVIESARSQLEAILTGQPAQ